MTAAIAPKPALAPEPAPRHFLIRIALPAAAAGAIAALGFAPLSWFPLTPLGLAVLFTLWTFSACPRDAAWAGFFFGLGFFHVGVSWVFVSLHFFGRMPMLLAALATFLFCSYLALFPAAAGWMVAKSRRDAMFKLLVIAPAAFVALEWTRGWLFTGFPWLAVGYTQAPGGWLAGFAPLGGLYAISWLLAVSAGLLALLWYFRRDRSMPLKLIAAGVLAAIWLIGALLQRMEWSEPVGEPVKVALLQGNIPQDLKWQAEVRAATLEQYRQMALATDARLIVFPETSLPMFFDQLPRDYLRALLEHADANGADVLLGTVERTSADGAFDYYNSVIAFGKSGPQNYRKSHLVPFGEFIPFGFKWVLAILKIPLTDFASGDEMQKPLKVAGQRIAANICYEDAFGSEILRQLPEATMMVNVSNVAWFGRSWAADQHFQMSQMRSLETSRWMLRATNTGATGAIDEKGRTVALLPQFETRTLVVAAQGRKGATPYVLLGNWPILLVLALSLAIAFIPVGKRGK
jgi:apolipoprotein N-acyltransferase